MYWADAGSVFVMILVKLDPIWHHTPTPRVRPPNSPRLFSISFSTNPGTCFMSRDLVKTARSHVNKTLSSELSNYHPSLTYDTWSSKKSSSNRRWHDSKSFYRLSDLKRVENNNISHFLNILLTRLRAGCRVVSVVPSGSDTHQLLIWISICISLDD